MDAEELKRYRHETGDYRKCGSPLLIEAEAPQYPLAGHQGRCNKVLVAGSYGVTDGVCTCNRDEILEEAAKMVESLHKEHTNGQTAEFIRQLKENQ